MNWKVRLLVAICMLAAVPAGAQPVVRFETSVGHFDMVLNPTNNPLLDEHADNMLHYVNDNRYNSTWINRAAENFVLQMGGFYSHTKRPPLTIDSTRPVATFAPVQGEPASTITGLSNTVGTVSLALPGDGFGGTNQDAGTSSFFVNLASNTFLDADFTVFAAIPDMTAINQIMALMQIDRTTEPDFGAGAGNLGFSDVPLQSNGFQVFINRAFEIHDPLELARARAGVASTMAASASAGDAASFGSSASLGGGESSPGSFADAAVPEPTTLLMLLTGISAASLLRQGRQWRRGR